MKDTLRNNVRGHQPGMVGIFWLVKNCLLTRAISLDEAESYGECLAHGQSHIRCWEALKRTGEVSQDSEYDEFPRGRVTFNTREELFYLFADNCIRRSPTRMDRIMRTMHLQANTIVLGDPKLAELQRIMGISKRMAANYKRIAQKRAAKEQK